MILGGERIAYDGYMLRHSSPTTKQQRVKSTYVKEKKIHLFSVII